MFCWWRDIIREGTFEGQHTHIVRGSVLLAGILLKLGVFGFLHWSKTS